jgi:MoxR-like ATPase
MYITPTTKVYSTFTEAKEFFTEYGGVSLFDHENRLEISDLAQGKRNLIVGEPGIGKTLLLEKICTAPPNFGQVESCF